MEEPTGGTVLECVINVSEGRAARLEPIVAAAGASLLDVHTDAHHHRSVLTVVGEEAARAVAAAAVSSIDLRRHAGAHPRLGAVDVVPFIALDPTAADDARRARDRFCQWAAGHLRLPAFAYGDERTLPQVRRRAFRTLVPTCGPPAPHPTAGAVAVGVREALVAYNLWLAEPDLDTARRLARALRGTDVRALGLQVGGQVQVSMNLVAPERTTPADVYDRVAAEVAVDRAELVGLVPRAVLRRVPPPRWEQLDLGEDRTIEHRLERCGLTG